MKLGIVDLDTGNLASLLSALNKLNINFKICKNSFDFEDVDKIILPGVGAFDSTMQQLIDSGFRDKLNELVLLKRIPILGICVGLQVMGFGSEEGEM